MMILTNEQFRKKVIAYMDASWREIFEASDIADECGYSDIYFIERFKDCFGVSFLQYLMKYKLHRAAQMIIETGSLTNVGRLIGYANPQSFSKAFRKEFGVSPKVFLQSDMEVPDMPDYYYIEGNPVKVAYERTKEMTVHVSPVVPIYEDKEMTDRYYEYFYGFSTEHLDFSNDMEDCIGMWWHDEQCSMRYVVGNQVEHGKCAPKGQIKITMPSGYYAVLSVKFDSGGVYKPTISALVNQLYTYAKDEWVRINKKTVNKAAILYQRYTKKEIFLYVPVFGREKNETQRDTMRGPDEWVKYIDDHIKEELSVISLAENYNYSVRHFSNTFELYFGIRPGKYIKKRKLYLAASELKNENIDIQQLVDKFGLQSVDSFRESFFAEFHSYPEVYSGVEYKAEDMKQYYSKFKDAMLITYTDVDDFSMYGKNVSVGFDTEVEHQELLESIVLELNVTDAHEKHNKVVVWQTLAESEERACLVGPEGVIPHEKEDDYIRVVIKGGSYAVMESQSSSEEETLLDSYRTLYRCAFDGWIRENQVRIDFRRLTFVRYQNGKLYFYIPVNA